MKLYRLYETEFMFDVKDLNPEKVIVTTSDINLLEKVVLEWIERFSFNKKLDKQRIEKYGVVDAILYEESIRNLYIEEIKLDRVNFDDVHEITNNNNEHIPISERVRLKMNGCC